jgi:hypothetical protein
MFDVAVIPYRTMNFAKRFGLTVRDLMMLRALEDCGSVATVDWFERPSLFVENIISRGNKPQLGLKTKVHSRIAFNPFPPLMKKRMWPMDSLRVHGASLKKWARGGQNIKVLLDFHPLYIPSEELLRTPGLIYWYDLIDDFQKHNVYTKEQQEAVKNKYRFVRDGGAFVTGVSDAAVSSFPGGLTLPNRLLRSAWAGQSGRESQEGRPAFDLGFTGFITDKFDIGFVRRIAAMGYKILIRGKAYHRHVADELSTIKGVEVGPEFHASEQAAILRQFSIGMIPYIPERCHEESPIKLVQYLVSGRPAILSKSFGSLEQKFQRWVSIYQNQGDGELRATIEDMLALTNDPLLKKAVDRSSDIFWDSQIESVLRNAQAAGNRK